MLKNNTMSDKPLGERIAKLETGFTNICDDIKEIKNKLLGRPSWSVSVIITILTTLSGSLVMILLT